MIWAKQLQPVWSPWTCNLRNHMKTWKATPPSLHVELDAPKLFLMIIPPLSSVLAWYKLVNLQTMWNFLPGRQYKQEYNDTDNAIREKAETTFLCIPRTGHSFWGDYTSSPLDTESEEPWKSTYLETALFPPFSILCTVPQFSITIILNKYCTDRFYVNWLSILLEPNWMASIKDRKVWSQTFWG